jgi:hypothetical protein
VSISYYIDLLYDLERNISEEIGSINLSSGQSECDRRGELERRRMKVADLISSIKIEEAKNNIMLAHLRGEDVSEKDISWALE